MNNDTGFRNVVKGIINRPLDYYADNIIDIARIYKALEYLKKRALREDASSAMSKQAEFETMFKDATQESVKQILGRQWKQQIVTLKRFADVVKWRFDNSHVAPIGTYEDDLVRIFKGHKNVNNNLKTSMKIGLFNRVSNYYDCKDNVAYLYSMNDNIYKIIKDIYDIVIKDNKSKIDNTINLESSELDSYYIEEKLVSELSRKIRVGSDLSGINITGISDDTIYNILNTKYTQVSHYQNIAEELNKSLPDEEKIIFKWNIERRVKTNEMLSKVGIRACSKMTNYKKRSRAYDSITFKGKYREDYLDKVYGKNNWTEFDFKSSIWQLTYFLNKGIWLNNKTDLYNEIYKLVIDKQGFKSKKQRNLFKLFGNVVYFDNPKMQGIHTLSKIYDLRNWLIGYYEFAKDEVNDYDKQMYNNELEVVDYCFKTMREGVLSVVGELYGSEIFLHESCLYMELYYRLKNLGYDIKQVFDGFYMKKSDYNNIKTYIQDTFYKILNDYKSRFSISNNKITKNKSIYIGEKLDFSKSKKQNQKNNDIEEAIKREENLKSIAGRIYKAIVKEYNNANIGKSKATELTNSLGYRFDTSLFVKSWCQNDSKVIKKLESYINAFKKEINK